MRPLLCPKLASQQLLYRTKISADQDSQWQSKSPYRKPTGGNHCSEGCLSCFLFVCSASHCRTEFREKQAVSFLNWEVWEFPTAKKGKTKASILNLS